jgi:hypothetical protein
MTARDGAQMKSRDGGLPVPVVTRGASFLSPRVRARMAELQLTNADLAGILGTGAGNRVTIKDLENFLHKIEDETATEASAIRAGVADAMRRSWSRPLATIGSSVNLDPVLQDRQSRDPKPGPALYTVRALALALAENPAAAAKFIGGRVVQTKPHSPILRQNTTNSSGLRGSDAFRQTCKRAALLRFQILELSALNGARRSRCRTKRCSLVSALGKKSRRGAKRKTNSFQRPGRKSH